jgi:hypothetical protein
MATVMVSVARDGALPFIRGSRPGLDNQIRPEAFDDVSLVAGEGTTAAHVAVPHL